MERTHATPTPLPAANQLRAPPFGNGDALGVVCGVFLAPDTSLSLPLPAGLCDVYCLINTLVS